MQAEEKLEEARYFLRMLNATPQDIAHEREVEEPEEKCSFPNYISK